MPDVILSTLNARYSHASFALRYLLANMGPLRERTRLMEFECKNDPAKIAEALLASSPRIVALGVYIWNVVKSTEVVRHLKTRAPDVVVVVGGPEVSFEIEEQEICRLADYVVAGEADFTFPELCSRLLEGQAAPDRIIQSPPADVRKLVLPYDLYTADDIANRIVYVEASRGCPFTCEFCLSSLDVPLRRFPLETFLPAMQDLLDRGLRHFKFVDRTFNLSIAYSMKLLEFFLERYTPGLFLHFEMIPDRLPLELREIICAFPPGTLQFEVGIQTFNESVAKRIKRKQDYVKTVDNLRFLLEQTGSYIHADLIYGLPGEDLASFAAGFDRLYALRPQEIQVNQLKRLRGTPIVRHDTEWAMKYGKDAPYEVESTATMDAETLLRLRRFSRFWDLVANSGNFLETTPRLFRDAPSAFFQGLELSDFLFPRFGKTHALSLDDLALGLFDFLVARCGASKEEAATVVARDIARGGRRDVPVALRPHLSGDWPRADRTARASGLKRQARRATPSPSPASPASPS